MLLLLIGALLLPAVRWYVYSMYPTVECSMFTNEDSVKSMSEVS